MARISHSQKRNRVFCVASAINLTYCFSLLRREEADLKRWYEALRSEDPRRLTSRTAARGQATSEGSAAGHQQCYSHENRRIGGAHAEKQILQHTRQSPGRRHSRRHSRKSQNHSLI